MGTGVPGLGTASGAAGTPGGRGIPHAAVGAASIPKKTPRGQGMQTAPQQQAGGHIQASGMLDLVPLWSTGCQRVTPSPMPSLALTPWAPPKTTVISLVLNSYSTSN